MERKEDATPAPILVNWDALPVSSQAPNPDHLVVNEEPDQNLIQGAANRAETFGKILVLLTVVLGLGHLGAVGYFYSLYGSFKDNGNELCHKMAGWCT